MSRADEAARVWLILEQHQIPMTPAAIQHAAGVGESVIAKMEHEGLLERIDHNRRLRLRSTNGKQKTSSRKSRPVWCGQANAAAAGARRRLGKRHPASLVDLVRAVERSGIPVTKLPGGHHLGHRVSWLESGIAPVPKPKPKPRGRPASTGGIRK